MNLKFEKSVEVFRFSIQSLSRKIPSESSFFVDIASLENGFRLPRTKLIDISSTRIEGYGKLVPKFTVVCC